jgi:carbon monoxide dehydrogenase subunit G
MQIEETFGVDAPVEAVWRFFEDVPRVARCVPGVQTVDVLAPDRYRVVATQKVGFISATFEMTTQVDGKEPLRSLRLSSVGKSVKGAVGTLRSRDRVDLAAQPSGGTQVTLTSELMVGGMLGALGHKAIAAKSRELTEKFAQALRAELQGPDAHGG